MFVRLLGDIGVGSDEHTVKPVPGRVAAAVLAHLVLAQGRVLTAQAIAAAVWDNPPDSARNAIQVAVSKLRRVFGVDLVASNSVGYRIATAGLRVDLHEFEALVSTGQDELAAGRAERALATAISAEALFAGEPLAGLDSAAAESVRQRINDRRSAARQLQARALLDLERADESVVVLQEEVARAGFAEPAHALLMQALGQAGRPADALTVYEQLRTRLADELGADPSPEVAAVFAGLLTQSPPAGRSERAAAQTRLPAESGPLLGRDTELDRVVSDLAGGQRVVTLLGPGGVGKTRLAVAAARQLSNSSATLSAQFVDLTSVQGGSAIRQAVAASFRLDPRQLSSVLLDADVLLVLDNAEEAIDALAEVVPWLLGGTGVRLLITSQCPLRLREERQVWLGALSTEPPDRPAVALLADRAGLYAAERSEQMRDLVALARRADGVPLVLELLASSLRWESASDLLARLDAAMPDLEDDARDRPARQLSVRSAISWSLGQASQDARRALGALTVFKGSFASTAAAAVLEAELPATAVRRVMAELVDLSLVQRISNHGDIRFHLLEPIRLCVLNSDRVPAPTKTVRRAHALHYFGGLGTTVDARSAGEDYAVIREHESNLRVALEWAWAEDPDTALAAVQPLMGARWENLGAPDSDGTPGA